VHMGSVVKLVVEGKGGGGDKGRGEADERDEWMRASLEHKTRRGTISVRG
jgi:hypothetical protein